jgi:hypothetical protein
MNIFVERADVAEFPCDVLVLKFAQAFFGVDKMVVGRLGRRAKDVSLPSPGDHVFVPSKGLVAARTILLLGVVDLYEFDYAQIREFAKRSVHILTREMPDAAQIAMTVHGVNYGLDERESFLAQLAGLLEVFDDDTVSPALKRITIVEQNQNRASRLQQILEKNLPPALRLGHVRDMFSRKPKLDAGLKSDIKPHVFVAMPFGDEMEDTYRFGIQGPVNACGFLCERVDMATFTGDILDRIKSRIQTASLVVADLTGANANVYLEVGYAWGKERPTLFMAKKGEDLKFDVKGQKCITYKNITDLAKRLQADLEVLKEELGLLQ